MAEWLAIFLTIQQANPFVFLRGHKGRPPAIGHDIMAKDLPLKNGLVALEAASRAASIQVGKKTCFFIP